MTKQEDIPCPYCGSTDESIRKEALRVLREFSVACKTTDPEAFDNEIMRLCSETRLLLMEVNEE